MPQIPLPQQGLQVPGRGIFTAPRFGRPTGDPQSAQFARMGQAMLQGGLQLAEAGFALEVRTDVAAVKEKTAIFEEKLVDADVAFMSRKGKAATGDSLKVAEEEFSSQMREIRDSLAPGRQQDRYNDYVSRRMPGVRGRWLAHYTKEVTAYDLGASAAHLEALKNSAVQQGIPDDQPELPEPLAAPEGLGGEDPQDPAGARTIPGAGAAPKPPKDLLESVERNAQAFAAKRQMSPEEADLFVQQQTSDVISGRVRTLVDTGRSTTAEEYLADNRDKVVGPEAIKLQGLVSLGSDKDQAARLVVEVEDALEREQRESAMAGGVVGPPPPHALDVTASDLLIQGRTRIEGMFREDEISLRVRDYALADLERTAGRRRDAELEDINAMNLRAEQIMQETEVGVDGLPAEVLDFGRRWGLTDDWRRFSGSQGRYGDNPQLFYDIQANPELLREMPWKEFVTRFRTSFARPTFNQVAGIWEAVNKPVEPQYSTQSQRQRHIDAGLQALVTDPRFVKGGFFGRGGISSDFRRTGKAGLPVERTYRWNVALRTLIEDFERTSTEGKPATDAQLEDIVNKALQNVAYTADNKLLPVAAMTLEERTGLTRAEREERIDANLPIEDAGASVDAEQMTRWMQRHDLPIPEDLGEEVFLGNIPGGLDHTAVGAALNEDLREAKLPVTAIGRAALWVSYGRPKTLQQLEEADTVLLSRESR